MKRRILFTVFAALFMLTSVFFASCGGGTVKETTAAPSGTTEAPGGETTEAESNAPEATTAAPKPYDVTLNVTPAEGGKVTGDGAFAKGTNVKITAEPNQGYTFGGWYTDTTLVTAEATYEFELKYHTEYTARFISDSGDTSGKVVFVKTGGEGDGSSAESPLGSIEAALELIGSFSDGTVVVMGEYTYAAQLEAPQNIGAITITGKYDGVDYESSIKNTGTGHYLCGSDTTFTDIKLTLTSTMIIRARFHKLTFAETFTTEATAGGIPKLYIVGGDQGATGHYNNEVSGDINLVILGGTYLEVLVAARSGAPDSYTGTVNAYLDNCEVDKVCLGARTAATVNTNDVNVTVGNVKINIWISQGDSKVNGITGKLVLTFLSTFDIDKCFNGAPDAVRTTTDGSGNVIFNGICGASAFESYTIKDDAGNNIPGGTYKDQMALAEALICRIDASIYDKVTSSEKFVADSFTAIEKVGG